MFKYYNLFKAQNADVPFDKLKRRASLSHIGAAAALRGRTEDQDSSLQHTNTHTISFACSTKVASCIETQKLQCCGFVMHTTLPLNAKERNVVSTQLANKQTELSSCGHTDGTFHLVSLSS